MAEIFGFDAYSPSEIAEKVENVGVVKARLPLLSVAMLGLLAGAFIGLGAMYYTIVAADSTLGLAASRVLGGITFSLGLVLVVVAGAELFTGNNLLVMAWVSRKISTAELMRNWTVVYISNFFGSFGIALLVVLSHHWGMGGGAVGQKAVAIAALKATMPFWEAFFRGILCNLLVCLAIWLTLAGRSVTDKILAIIFPISAFVAAGFEHSVANMYFIPLGVMLGKLGVGGEVQPDVAGLIHNLVPVTLGNIVGGSLLVAVVYYVIYRRRPSVKAGGGEG